MYIRIDCVISRTQKFRLIVLPTLFTNGLKLSYFYQIFHGSAIFIVHSYQTDRFESHIIKMTHTNYIYCLFYLGTFR